MLLTAMSGLAQDANISQMRQDASAVDRHPGGDRDYYGLWYKDHLLGRPEPKPRFESAEDSIQKRKEFIRLCAVAFEAYDQKDVLKTVVYGDSALRTGFDNQQIFFYMADSYETLGDDERALSFYKEAKSHGILVAVKRSRLSRSEPKPERKRQRKTLQNEDRTCIGRWSLTWTFLRGHYGRADGAWCGI